MGGVREGIEASVPCGVVDYVFVYFLHEKNEKNIRIRNRKIVFPRCQAKSSDRERGRAKQCPQYYR